MAQKDDDEYQMDDLDSMDSEHLGEEKTSPEASAYNQSGPGETKVRRNALIVIGLIVLLVLLYKFFGSSSSKEQPIQAIPSMPQTTEAPPPTSAVVETPQQQPTTQPQTTTQPSVDTSEISQKLSTVEASQQDVRLEVNAVNSKLNGISTNVGDLTAKIADLNQMVGSLVSKLEQQSNELAMMREKAKPKQIHHHKKRVRHHLTYNIKAIIPGRAWLIAKNGSTITVREGTRIAGFGIVKLIDPIQGRVLLSSGRVIRFSQLDS